MDNSVIINSMSDVKNHIFQELGNVYSDIYSQVSTASVSMFANLFTSLEAKAISSFYVKLEKETRQYAYEAMKRAGVPENDIPLVWIRTRNAVPAPQAKLCKEGNYNPPRFSSNNQGTEKKVTQKENSQTLQLGKWILISGTVVEILSWIFIPSRMIWAPIVRGMGLVIMGAGAFVIYHENKHPTQIPLTEPAKKMVQKQGLEDVKKICNEQCELNTGIYCNWVDSITSAIVKECASY